MDDGEADQPPGAQGLFPTRAMPDRDSPGLFAEECTSTLHTGKMFNFVLERSPVQRCYPERRLSGPSALHLLLREKALGLASVGLAYCLLRTSWEKPGKRSSFLVRKRESAGNSDKLYHSEKPVSVKMLKLNCDFGTSYNLNIDKRRTE